MTKSIYKEAREAALAIDKMIAEGMSHDKIAFKIKRMYGRSRKFVDECIEEWYKVNKEGEKE